MDKDSKQPKLNPDGSVPPPRPPRGRAAGTAAGGGDDDGNSKKWVSKKEEVRITLPPREKVSVTIVNRR